MVNYKDLGLVNTREMFKPVPEETGFWLKI